MKNTVKKPSFKVKVDYNTWLEFPNGTKKTEVKARIENFKSKVGKYNHGDPSKHQKSTF